MAERFVIPTSKPGPFTLGPDSQRQPGVPQGAVTQHEWRSTIFPGTVRDYWVYVPAQYTPDKPANVMVFLQAGSNDLDRDWGNWALANLEMAAALNFAGYDYRLEFGDGEHDTKHAGAILPESLTWLWR